MNKEQKYIEKLYDGLDYYINLWNKGLKKQANQYIKNFICTLEKDLDENSLNNMLEQFCYDYFEEGKYFELKNRGNSTLPHELNRIVWNFLKNKSDTQSMPHMRWLYQLYGTSYNPFDQKREYDTDLILKKAYEHEKCDQKTVDLYFKEQLNLLQWWAHHFPEGCLTTKQIYLETVNIAEQIIKEHFVDNELVEDFDYWKKLYQCYYKFVENGRKEDFYKICETEGIVFYECKSYYY